MDVFVERKKEGGAVAVVTGQTLSQQLRKSVFTKIKLLLSGVDFFKDGCFQFTVRLRGRKKENEKKKRFWLLFGLNLQPFSHKAVQQATLSPHYTVCETCVVPTQHQSHSD